MRGLKKYRYILAQPQVSTKAFVARGAILIGAVFIGDYSSVWYNTVIRADINKIEIGTHTNIQDGCILHVSDDLGVKVADYVTVGHRAILHACTISSGALIGSGAVILNAARVGEEAVVAAGSLLPPNFTVPAGTLAKGSPAKIARRLSRKERDDNRRWALKYARLIREYRKQYESGPWVASA